MKSRIWLLGAVLAIFLALLALTHQTWWRAIAVAVLSDPKPFSMDLSTAAEGRQSLQMFVSNNSDNRPMVKMTIAVDSAVVHDGFVPPGAHNHLAGRVYVDTGTHTVRFTARVFGSTITTVDTVVVGGARWLRVWYSESPKVAPEIYMDKHVGEYSGVGLDGA